MKSLGIIIEKEGQITPQKIEQDKPRVIKGKIGSKNINNTYVRIPINAENIKAVALFPFLSIRKPIKGISNEDIRKGKAIAIPT